MFRAVTKIFSAGLVCGILLSAPSCGDSKAEAGGKLLDKANEKYEQGDYAAALSIVEEIDSLYRGETDLRRKAMHLKPRIIEQITLGKLAENDSLIAVTQIFADSVGRTMRFVSNPVEGYYVARTEPADINTASGLYARVSPDGHFYMVAVNAAGGRSNAISVSVGGESAMSSSLPSDGERVDRSGPSEVMTFMQVECDSVGSLISRHGGEPFTVSFIGSGKSVNVSAAQSAAIADVYKGAESIRTMKLLQVQRNKLEKTLSVARSQIARTLADSTDVK